MTRVPGTFLAPNRRDPLDATPSVVHNVRINVARKNLLSKWQKKHADARSALARWVRIVEQGEWRSSADVAATFGRSADRINERGVVAWIFNIGDNSYRLIATVDFPMQIVTPLFFLTHAEYDRGRWKDRL